MVDNALDQKTGWPSNSPPTDPAPKPEDIARDRMKALLEGSTSITLDNLRQLRDEIDTLMRIIIERKEHISDAFNEHTKLLVDVIKAKEVIKESLGIIGNEFRNGVNIPKVMT